MVAFLLISCYGVEIGKTFFLGGEGKKVFLAMCQPISS